jgi:uncharacterized protein YigE (DUF2233 family)
MNRAIATLALCLCTLASARSERWVEQRTRTLTRPTDPLCLVEKTVRPVSGDPAREVELQLAIFHSRTHTLRVIDNGTRTDRNLASAMRASACLAGVNGGYFHATRAPLGLVVSDGVLLSPRANSPLATGIVRAKPRTLELLRLEESQPDPATSQALQAGPFLVDRARPVAGLNATRPARRTFILTNGRGLWAIGTAHSPTLADLGDLLAQGLGGIAAERALNLDGGGSTGFWFYRGGTNDVYRPELNPVRNYLGVVPR